MTMNILVTILLAAPPVLLAITLHEAAHAYAAKYFGDNTAAALGRLSLNPFRHIDPIYTVVVPAVVYAFTGFIFGAAKPVPVVASNFKRPYKDMAWVGLAGPASNILMLLVWLALYKFAAAVDLAESNTIIITSMAKFGIMINAILAVFNLIPLSPLDGSHVMRAILPVSWHAYYNRSSALVFLLLLVVLLSGMGDQFFDGIHTLYRWLLTL